jgi:sulfite reductase (NADPH) flavoprotein alpha-component
MKISPIPKTAPFAEDEIDILNRVVGPASATQRAWLAGFLAGLDAAHAAPQPAAPAQAAQPLTILYATESGNAERLASDVAKSARKLGFKPALVDMADLELADLVKARRLIVIASTWGEGDPPARAVHAYADLMSEKAPRLDGVEFGVLALGDSAYAEFCAIGKAIDARLEALGAKRVAERVDCDVDFAEPAARWIDSTLHTLAPPPEARGTVIAVDFAARQPSAPDLEPVEVEITEKINLNSSRSDKETIHLELALPAGFAYQPGDSLDIYPQNDPAYVDALLQASALSGDAALREKLISSRDVTTLSLKTLQNFVAATGHADAKALLDSGNAASWIAGRQLIDLLETFPTALSAETLEKITRPIVPRAYSIASSQREFADEAHVLVAPVRYETHGRVRAGVASSHIADRLRKGDRLRVKLRPNRHFALPAPDKDIIMVGPGTGIAPFRAFVQERRATAASGRNWLFFGDRRFTHDFLYQLEWQDALADGALTRIDLAFSRDTPEKIYVQHRMWEARRELVDWLDGGAYFYVCGDAKKMAKDVRAMLVRVLADVKGLAGEAAEAAVRELEKSRRYLQDVY